METMIGGKARLLSRQARPLLLFVGDDAAGTM